MRASAVLLGLALALAPAAAWAHAEAHPGGGFGAGFLHPIQGLDHVVAMVAVGLWGGVGGGGPGGSCAPGAVGEGLAAKASGTAAAEVPG